MAKYDVICLPCVTAMEKTETGKKVQLPNGYCMSADVYECPHCGRQVLADGGNPYPDRHPDSFDYAVRGYD